jgi:uncharacterized phage protein (TIGR01671 family)
MREILFRGKSKDYDYAYGHWIYGNLTHLYGYKGDKLYEIEEVYENSRNPKSYLVDEETIGQYTGLKDFNGKKIFEGDILRLADGETNIYVVYWSESRSSFCLIEYTRTFVYRGDWQLGVMLVENEGTVIGNIHDNPELLKGGNNERPSSSNL